MKTVHKNKMISNTARADREPVEVAKLEKLPRPANWMGANKNARKIYREVGTKLLEHSGMAVIDFYAVMMLAIALEQYAWATKEIEKKNNTVPGTGYRQTFITGAQQISVELSIREKAQKQVLDLMNKFGGTLRDRLTLNQPNVDPNQTNLFEGFAFATNQ